MALVERAVLTLAIAIASCAATRTPISTATIQVAPGAPLVAEIAIPQPDHDYELAYLARVPEDVLARFKLDCPFGTLEGVLLPRGDQAADEDRSVRELGEDPRPDEVGANPCADPAVVPRDRRRDAERPRGPVRTRARSNVTVVEGQFRVRAEGPASCSFVVAPVRPGTSIDGLEVELSLY
jgi:hypothetical protein